MNFEEWWSKWQNDTEQRFSDYDKQFAEEAWDYQQNRIAELTAQKTRSQEHYIKLLNDAEAENQRLRELFDRWESSGDVVAASYAMQAKLVQGGGE